MRHVSATDANREFSRLLREVRGGETVTVTSKGHPVAVIAPADLFARSGQDGAKAALLARLRAQPCAGAAWTRGELHDEGEAE